MRKQITITKVVSRDFFQDIIVSVQNFLGLNLTPYEVMIRRAIKQIEQEIGNKKLIWFRYEISQLQNGAMAILLYGETEE